MRTALKYIATGLLCLALLTPCACSTGQVTHQTTPPADPVETPAADPAPAVPPPTEPAEAPAPSEPAAPKEPDPAPTATGDVPALYRDEETELAYRLAGQDLTIPAVRHHTLHGYTIVYDAMHYECRTYHEVDSYWSAEGLYLSVSIVYGMPVDYVLDGLQLQENIEMAAELTYIGAGDYAAYTLYTNENGLHRQFWALDYAGDTMLIEQSYPLEHEYAEFHRVIQLAMLDTLTLDHPPAAVPAAQSTLTAYAEALENLYCNRIFPDGSPADPNDSFGDISDNRFAIYDIDNDGRDELIIEYTTTIVAGQSLQVYDYEEGYGRFRLQFQTFPNVTFYDNGVIEARASHTQGTGGAFWPYDLYVYDAAEDGYTRVGSVDAWDKSVPVPGFPEEADTSGTGFVYYINGSAPVDYTVYHQWRSAYSGDAAELMLPYQFLTEENIAAI